MNVLLNNRSVNMVLSMSNEEIYSSYMQAKDRIKQVKILAELNACPIDTIVEILKASGVDGRCLPRKSHKNESKIPRNVSTKKSNNRCPKSEDKSTNEKSLTVSTAISIITRLQSERIALLHRISEIDKQLGAIQQAAMIVPVNAKSSITPGGDSVESN